MSRKTVSRETSWHKCKVNEEILFAYTEFPEDHVEDILDVHPTQQPPEGMRGDPKFLRRQFLALLRRHLCCDAAKPPSPAAIGAA